MIRWLIANPYVGAGVVLGILLALGGFGYWCYDRGQTGERAAWVVKLDEQKANAVRLQSENKDRLLRVAHAFIDLHIQTEKVYADASKKADAEHNDNLRLGADIGRLLHDQGRWLSGAYTVSPDPAAAGGGAGGPAPGEFLGAVERLIADGTRLTAEADDIANVAIACRAYAIAAPALASKP